MNKKNSMKNLKYGFRSLQTLIKSHPTYLFLQIFDTICNVLITLIPIDLINKIVNIYSQVDLTTNKKITSIIYTSVIYVVILIISSSFLAVTEAVNFYIRNHFTLSFSTRLFKKLETIDYAFHEQENFLDNYTRALDNGPENIYYCATCQVDLIKQIIISISIFAFVMSTNYLSIVYSVLVAILFYFLRRGSSKLLYKERSERRPIMRERWYLGRVYFVKDAIPDIKTTGINDVLLKNHSKVSNNMLTVYKKYGRKRAILEVTGAFLMSTIYPIILLVTIHQILKNNDLALFASLTVAAGKISNLVTRIADIVGEIQDYSLEAKVPFEVLEMSGEIEKTGEIADTKEFSSLVVEDLSFKYTDKLVLNNVSLNTKKGEKIAIVGANGAGKTTLVKMLLRLYDPINGNIKINGIDYRDLNTDALRKTVGAVFQNSEVYSVTVGENILLRKLKSEDDYKLVTEALKFAGIYDFVMSLEKGIDTVVTKEFDRNGVVFSGGNQQKLAVARGYAQNYDLFILDEPSSALDPLAETKMYQNMLELGKEKTIIFISHRLSATANVNRIYLFEYGKIIEQGTHEELMRNKTGRYYEMFSSQSEKYLRGENND